MQKSSFSDVQGFFKLAQYWPSNLLQTNLTNKRNDIANIDQLGNKTVLIESKTKEFKMMVDGYAELKGGIHSSAAMLLECLMITATMGGLKNTLIKMPLCDYMALRGLNDEPSTREQVKRDIEALWRVSFEYRDKRKGTFVKARILGDVGYIKNSEIIFGFSHTFFNIFMVDANEYLFMFFPLEALQGKINHHPYKYWLAREIALHKRMNLEESNENVISIKTLIGACPNFPTYEQVNRNALNRIIKLFEQDMNELSSVFKWEYSGTSPTTYDEFMSAIIKIHWINYPEYAIKELRDKKAGQIKTAIHKN
jgi:hypothetical protein